MENLSNILSIEDKSSIHRSKPSIQADCLPCMLTVPLSRSHILNHASHSDVGTQVFANVDLSLIKHLLGFQHTYFDTAAV